METKSANPLRDRILASKDIEEERLYIKEWDTHLLVRGMTGSERDSFEGLVMKNASLGPGRQLERLKTLVVALSCYDPKTGKRIFNDNGDVEQLGKKSAGAIDKVFQVAQRLSHILDKDVKEMAGNLPAAQSGASGSN